MSKIATKCKWTACYISKHELIDSFKELSTNQKGKTYSNHEEKWVQDIKNSSQKRKYTWLSKHRRCLITPPQEKCNKNYTRRPYFTFQTGKTKIEQNTCILLVRKSTTLSRVSWEGQPRQSWAFWLWDDLETVRILPHFPEATENFFFFFYYCLRANGGERVQVSFLLELVSWSI